MSFGCVFAAAQGSGIHPIRELRLQYVMTSPEDLADMLKRCSITLELVGTMRQRRSPVQHNVKFSVPEGAEEGRRRPRTPADQPPGTPGTLGPYRSGWGIGAGLGCVPQGLVTHARAQSTHTRTHVSAT